MKLKRTFTLACSAVLSIALITGCGSNVKSASGSEASAAIASAESAIKKMNALGWKWRDTGKFMKQAKAAKKKGDNGKAVKLANKAKGQAELAVQQYHYEKTRDRSVKSKRRYRRKSKRRSKKS